MKEMNIFVKLESFENIVAKEEIAPAINFFLYRTIFYTCAISIRDDVSIRGQFLYVQIFVSD